MSISIERVNKTPWEFWITVKESAKSKDFSKLFSFYSCEICFIWFLGVQGVLVIVYIDGTILLMKINIIFEGCQIILNALDRAYLSPEYQIERNLEHGKFLLATKKIIREFVYDRSEVVILGFEEHQISIKHVSFRKVSACNLGVDPTGCLITNYKNGSSTFFTKFD